MQEWFLYKLSLALYLFITLKWAYSFPLCSISSNLGTPLQFETFFRKSKVGKLFFLQFSCYKLQTYLYYIYRVYKPNSHFFAETTKVATFQTIYCQEWSFMPTTQKLWLKRGQLTTWKRNENAKTCSMSSCQSKDLFLILRDTKASLIETCTSQPI